MKASTALRYYGEEIAKQLADSRFELMDQGIHDDIVGPTLATYALFLLMEKLEEPEPTEDE